MDIVDTSLGLAGTAFRLVMFSIDFVSDAKQVYRKGATDRTFDLALVAKSIQDSTGNLETQLQTVAKDEGEVGKLNSDKVCINIFIWVIRLSIVVTLLDFDCCLFFFFFFTVGGSWRWKMSLFLTFCCSPPETVEESGVHKSRDSNPLIP